MLYLSSTQTMRILSLKEALLMLVVKAGYPSKGPIGYPIGTPVRSYKVT